MSISRRGFLQKMVLTGASLSPLLVSHSMKAFASPFSPHHQPLQMQGDEEAFWKSVREQFTLEADRHYFNNGTVGPSPIPVAQAVAERLRVMDLVSEVGDSDEARKKLASFVGASGDEISLTHNTTEGINIVAWGLPLSRGDEVILTTHEHSGGAYPWLNRAKLEGIVLRTFEPAATGALNLEKIQSLINANTRVIAVPHISCTTGQVFPLKEIAALAQEKGIFSFFDGAHGTGSIELRLNEMGCDFYSSAGHKWICGPKGTGYLYVKKSLLEVLQAKWIGAYSTPNYNMSVNPPELSPYVPTAHRYDFGTQNHALYQGLGAAVDFFNLIGADKIYARGRALTQYFRDELEKRADRILVLTPEEKSSRAMMTGFRFKNLAADRFGAYAMARHKLRVRFVAEAGLNLVRVSTHLYNQFEEIDLLLEAIDSFRA